MNLLLNVERTIRVYVLIGPLQLGAVKKRCLIFFDNAQVEVTGQNKWLARLRLFMPDMNNYACLFVERLLTKSHFFEQMLNLSFLNLLNWD